MARALAFVALALAVLAAMPARAADCSALETGIDRGKLVFYVDDAAEADAIAAVWSDLTLRMQRAAEWMNSAQWRNADLGEAILNARRVAALVREEVPKLEARVAAMPEDGPEFPPVFFWLDGWTRLAKAVHDSLVLEAKYLDADADARAADDIDEALRITLARNADLAGFEEYFAAFDRQTLARLPREHPERLMVQMRLHWEGMRDLYSQRDALSDEYEQRRMTPEIVAKLEGIADAIEADVAGFDALLPPFREKLEAYFLTLTCDPAAAGAALDRYMESYARYPALAREAAELLRDYAGIERDFGRRGATPDLFERYDAVSFRYDVMYQKASDEWSKRARILVEAVARD